MKEIDGVRQIGGLKKEISDAMGKAEDWESQSIVKGNGKGRCDAVVGVLKKVDDRWSMVGKGMGKSIGNFFCSILSCLFFLFFLVLVFYFFLFY